MYKGLSGKQLMSIDTADSVEQCSGIEYKLIVDKVLMNGYSGQWFKTNNIFNKNVFFNQETKYIRKININYTLSTL